MIERSLEISNSCRLTATIYENLEADVYLNYMEHSPDSWYSNTETCHSLDPRKIRQLIEFLTPFAEPLS